MSVNDYENLIRTEIFNDFYQSFDSNIELAMFLKSLPLGTLVGLNKLANQWLEKNSLTFKNNGIYKKGSIIKFEKQNNSSAYYILNWDHSIEEISLSGIEPLMYSDSTNGWMSSVPELFWDEDGQGIRYTLTLIEVVKNSFGSCDVVSIIEKNA